MVKDKPAVAIKYADEVIATQRRCHNNQMPASKK
jgi:hypothetical protein